MRRRDPSNKTLMSLFEDFLECHVQHKTATYRTPETPVYERPFTQKNIQAAQVLADAFEERGQLRLAEKFRDVLRSLDSRGRMTYDERKWAQLYNLTLRVLTWKMYMRTRKASYSRDFDGYSKTRALRALEQGASAMRRAGQASKAREWEANAAKVRRR